MLSHVFATPWTIQSTLCNRMDYTVHGILQARILEWVTVSFSRGPSKPRDQTQVSHTAGIFFTSWAMEGSPRKLEWVAYPFSSVSSWPRNWTGVSCIAGGFLPAELPEKSALFLRFFFFSFLLLTKQEILLGRSAQVESSRVSKLTRTALPCPRFHGDKISFQVVFGH